MLGGQIFRFPGYARIVAKFVLEWATPESARRIDDGRIVTG